MNPSWADTTGLPTRHAIQAALRVAALIDPHGSPLVDAQETYWHVATGGNLPPPDLRMGESLLVDLGLAIVTNDVIYRTPLLDGLLEGDTDAATAAVIVASLNARADTSLLELTHVEARVAECVHDPNQRQDVFGVIAARFDDTHRSLVGEIGEEIVLHAARVELDDAGHRHLAAQVRQVSLVSDAYGYDIVAPRVHGTDRLLEVKATTTLTDGIAKVYLSRHEAEVGSTRAGWMLVLCHVHDIEQRHGEVIGWIGYRDLEPLLPTDAPHGRWQSTSIALKVRSLTPGLPSAFT